MTTAPERRLTIGKLRTDFGRRNYRQFEIKSLTAKAASRLTITTLGDLEGLEAEFGEKATSFDLDILQRQDGTSTTRKLSRLPTSPGKKLRIGPKNWKKLETTEVERSQLVKERIR
ncbi:MAG: hypothetical protein ACUVR0_09075 [Candidatus Aminicenantales bacterium]